MCVIIVMEKKVPSLDIFQRCERANGDGGGIAWKEGGKVHWKKGIKADEIFNIATEKGPGCVAHFRIGTIGGKVPELCHPFPVTKKAETSLEGSAERVIFHNGHWSKWDDWCQQMVLMNNAYFPGGDWSDSRAIAWLIFHSNSSFLRFANQKVVMMSGKKADTYYGSWEEKDGVFYSNLHWDHQYTKTSYGHCGAYVPPATGGNVNESKVSVEVKAAELNRLKEEVDKFYEQTHPCY